MKNSEFPSNRDGNHVGDQHLVRSHITGLAPIKEQDKSPEQILFSQSEVSFGLRSGQIKIRPVYRTEKKYLKPSPISQNRGGSSIFFSVGRVSYLFSINTDATSVRQKVSSWIVSFFIHVTFLLILAFILLPSLSKPTELIGNFSTELGDQLEFLTEDEGNLNPNESENYSLVVPEELKVEDSIIFEQKNLPFLPNIDAPLFDQTRIEMSNMLAGRTDPGLKNDLLSKYGGSELTEASVAAGLEWLRKQQKKDGSWSLQGPYSGGISSLDNVPAATALALLAFQGAGNTRYSGEHSHVVKRGWAWLLKHQNQDGSFAPSVRSNEALFYTQAICTIALCELITQEDRSNLKERKQAKTAVNFLLENQHKELGGWKYTPQESSDLSVTGWCVMALKTAEMAEIPIPITTYTCISEFLDSVSYDDGGGYVYQLINGKVTANEKRPSMTATGLLCREYLGWEQDTPALLRGAATLVEDKNLILFPAPQKTQLAEENYTNVYGWYSTTMALKGLGPYNRYWRKWNAVLSRELPRHQEPRSSKEAGSWEPTYDEYAFGGGRLYVTCLSIFCLEVYYRYLPIYR